MKINTKAIICLILMMSLALTANSWAATVGVDATTLKQLDIEAPPLDIDTSEDGKLAFVLVPGEVLIYSNLGSQPINRIAVGKNFDRLAFAEKIDVLILSSNADKQIKVVRIDLINAISIDGSPLRGKADAPVTIAVFDDYQ
ncbi:MAG: hypothetical protein JRI93_09585 [Deltaproteobacteria bacterium]|nr:hypothetical protein [Deltaproteobacteria bacterium]MBW2613637.1 hypothetical protein [Deltaproteobacteria bacterium]MBW2677693.1 hypothetical protein [Deltaproteobacteria bacterium]